MRIEQLHKASNSLLFTLLFGLSSCSSGITPTPPATPNKPYQEGICNIDTEHGQKFTQKDVEQIIEMEWQEFLSNYYSDKSLLPNYEANWEEATCKTLAALSTSMELAKASPLLGPYFDNAGFDTWPPQIYSFRKLVDNRNNYKNTPTLASVLDGDLYINFELMAFYLDNNTRFDSINILTMSHETFHLISSRSPQMEPQNEMKESIFQLSTVGIDGAPTKTEVKIAYTQGARIFFKDLNGNFITIRMIPGAASSGLTNAVLDKPYSLSVFEEPVAEYVARHIAAQNQIYYSPADVNGNYTKNSDLLSNLLNKREAENPGTTAEYIRLILQDSNLFAALELLYGKAMTPQELQVTIDTNELKSE